MGIAWTGMLWAQSECAHVKRWLCITEHKSAKATRTLMRHNDQKCCKQI